jgi:hypothetical protein
VERWLDGVLQEFRFAGFATGRELSYGSLACHENAERGEVCADYISFDGART